MSNTALVAVLIRVLGAFVALWALERALAVAFLLRVEERYDLFAASAGLVALWVAFGAAMLLVPGAIAERLVPERLRETRETGWTVDDVQAIGFSLVGLYLIATTLTGPATFPYALAEVWLWFGTSESVRPEHWLTFGLFVLRLVLGVWLLFGARGLRGLIRRARHAGME